MEKNRLLTLDKELKSYKAQRKALVKGKNRKESVAGNGSLSKISGVMVDADVFILEILDLFFGKSLDEKALNDDLRKIAAKSLWTAAKAVEMEHKIPRPPKGEPSIGWVGSEEVQKSFRKLQHKGLFKAVKPVVRAKWGSDFESALVAAAAKSLSFSEASYSEAQYGTGEHVLAGLVDADKVTPTYEIDVNGVKFTYGELIAMGDFYEDYEQMARAGAGELGKLKSLIDKSRRYYESKIMKGSPSGTKPSTGEWQSATGGRYVKLAEDNFAHFAPSSSKYIPSFSSSKPNHKESWEKYHKKAIDIMRKGSDSFVTDNALEVNAFGDHFLTDAFAAGHLFNKDDLSEYFKSRVLDSSGKLNANGVKMFDKIASSAFKGKLKSTFSKYETVKKYKGIFHPNIDSADRFSKLLQGIMEKEPDIIGKTMVAKLVHDKLNGYTGGVPVVNNKGKRWNLTGDNTLDKDNLKIMRSAVKQSIRNLYDAVNDNSAYSDFFKKVWDYTPRPTKSSVTLIKNMVKDCTNPLGNEIVSGADKLLQSNYQTLIDELVKRNVLQKA